MLIKIKPLMMVRISLSHNFCDKFDAQNQIKITYLTQKTGTDVGIMAEKVCKLWIWSMKIDPSC